MVDRTILRAWLFKVSIDKEIIVVAESMSEAMKEYREYKGYDPDEVKELCDGLARIPILTQGSSHTG